jgi:hypothetical protein
MQHADTILTLYQKRGAKGLQKDGLDPDATEAMNDLLESRMR